MTGLNLGCGPHANVASAEWLNVDRYSLEHWPQPPHVIADVLAGLPFPDDHFDRAYIGHLLEHLEYEVEVPAALAEVWRVCEAGSRVMVVGPCYDKAVMLNSTDELLGMIRPPKRDPGPPGIHHRWLPTTEATLRAVRAFDPAAEEVLVTGVAPPVWPNACPGALWQTAIYAHVVK